jgi:hypothetical protein
MPECSGEIQVSDDGKTFRTLRPFAFGRTVRSSAPFPSARNRSPRVLARAIHQRGAKAKATDIPLAEIELAPRLTIENIDAKDGFNGASCCRRREADDAADGAVQRGRSLTSLPS